MWETAASMPIPPIAHHLYAPPLQAGITFPANISITDRWIRMYRLTSRLSAANVADMLIANLLTVAKAVRALGAHVRLTGSGSEMAAKNRS